VKRNASLILFILLLLNTYNLSGQKQRPKNESWYDDKTFHFGFSLGFNAMDFNITPSQEYYKVDSLFPEITKLNPGINIQIITNLRLNQHFDLRFLPCVSFGQRTVKFYKNSVLVNDQQKLESSFLEFPLLLKYKGNRLNNVRPYVIGGLNGRYDLAGKKDFDDEKPIYIRVKRPDLYYELGAGLDFYLTYFKLAIELKMSNGMNNVMVRETAPGHPQYANAIEKIKSRIWVIAFHFE
jgi:hypothetical protein